LKKLLFGNTSAVIFFDEGEELWLEGLEPGMVDRKSVSGLLDAAGISPGNGKICLELFKNEGRSVLFISTPEDSDDYEIFEFDCLDTLLDCVEYIVPENDMPERSALYESNGRFYLVMSPPFCCQSSLLSEFGRPLNRPPEFTWFLSEHAKLIAAPSALTVLKRYF